MLLYDLPLRKQSLSIKCIGGLFTRSRALQTPDTKNQHLLTKKNWQIILVKSNSFELYKLKKSSKSQKIQLNFLVSTDIFGEICNIQSCTVKLSQSKQYIDLVLVTLNTGELLVYYFSKDSKEFICSYRDHIFKNLNSSINLQNVRHVGNYITCSDQNHFLITSVRCHKRLYSINASIQEGKLKVSIKSQDTQIKQNFICWNMIWLPSMTNQNEYYGKYVAIQRQMVTVQHYAKQSKMVEESQQKNITPKRLRYYFIQKSYRIIQRQQKKQGFRELKNTAHMLIPVSSSSFFILYQNRIYLREFSSESLKEQNVIIDTIFPIREALVDKNIETLFSSYSRQTIDGNKFRIYLMNEFGDLFKIQYIMTGTLIANFLIRYTNSIKTVHSIIYMSEVEESSLKINEGQPVNVKHESASLVFFGLERFCCSLYFLVPSKNMQTKPKQIKVAIRPVTKTKTTKTFPDYSDPQHYKPIIQRSRDLDLLDELQHMGTVVDFKISNFKDSYETKDKQKDDNFQIFALTNGGNLRHQQHIDQTIQNVQLHKSYLKIIKKGLKVKQVNSINYQKPLQIYCFKKSEKDLHHKIVILCIHGKTTVLSISNEYNLAFFRQLHFDQNVTTSFIGKFQDQSYIQIVNNRIRHIKKEKDKGSPKQIPLKNKIVHAVVLGRQLFLGIYGGEIAYFQLEKEKDQIQFKKQFYVNDQIVALQLTPIQVWKTQSSQRRFSRYLIIATKNFELLIYKILPKTEKQFSIDNVYSQNIKTPIESICATIILPDDVSRISEKTYCVFLGMQNGSMIKIQFDKTMKKVNHKVLQIGSKPVKLKRTSICSKKQDAVLILTEKTYLYYIHKNKYIMSLISYPNIQVAAQMKQPQNLNTIMVFSGSGIKLLSVQSCGEDFHDEKIGLFFSGKKLLVFQNHIGVIEADPSYEKSSRIHSQHEIDIDKNTIEVQKLQKNWKSQFTIYQTTDYKKISAIYFDVTRQTCLCAAYNYIKSGPQKGAYLIFGCVQGITYYPKFQTKNQTIKIYSWINSQKKTTFLYSLNIDSVPFVIQPFFKGQKFLIGIGKSLRLYEIGKKKLLKKAQTKNLPSSVNQIKTIGKKIFITSVSQSFHLFKYIPQEQTFYDIAEDNLPKFITAMNVLDAETVCAADKFGNIFIGRLSQNAKNYFQNINGSSHEMKNGHLYNFNHVASVNVGQIVTSIIKTTLFSSKTQIILYSTIMGQLRALYPLGDQDQFKLIPALQSIIRKKLNIEIVAGNNYGARKKVINAQIVQKFLLFSQQQQLMILKEISDQSTINDIQLTKQMIEGIRQKII